MPSCGVWRVQLPAGGTLVQELPAGSRLWLQTVTLAPHAALSQDQRCVLRASSNGASAVLCNLSVVSSCVKIALPFCGSVTFEAHGPHDIQLTGRHNGPLGPARTLAKAEHDDKGSGAEANRSAPEADRSVALPI